MTRKTRSERSDMKNIFVETGNCKAFFHAMTDATRAAGEPVLCVFWGQAGRGKTTTARKYAASEGWTYVRARKGWRTSDLWMLQDLCFELGIDPAPRARKPAFEMIREHLMTSPRPVLIDEADKLTDSLIEWVRDLADLTYAPFSLLGEKELLAMMRRQRRVWSRTLRAVEFGPVTAQDILFFAKEAAGLSLSGDQGAVLQRASDGDFRLVARDVRRLEDLAAANQDAGKPGRVSDELVQLAIKQGLRGQ